MKRTICIEWKNYSAQAFIDKFDRFYTKNSQLLGFCGCASSKSNKPWLAEITGLDDKYKFKRTFLNGSIDFSESNKSGNAGVKLYFIIEDDKIYQLREKSGKKEFKYFFKMVNGEEVKLQEEEVIECLKNR
jgi:hypothetical protein